MAYFIHNPLSEPLPDLTAETGPSGRLYKTPDGLEYPSLTTVLHILSEAAIADWRKRVGEAQADATSKRASERGTALHEAIERFLKNEDTSDITPATRILLNRSRLTLRRINNIVAQEIALWSDEMRVAGRCDCIADFDGIPSVIDFKTSDRVKKVEWIQSYFQQATGYSMMWQERTGRIVEQIVIIIVGDDGSCKPYVQTRADYINPLRETIGRYKATH